MDNFNLSGGGSVVGYKSGTQRAYTRNNRMTNIQGEALGHLLSSTEGRISGDIEESFNYIQHSGTGPCLSIDSGNYASSLSGPIYFLRNTCVGGIIEFWYANAVGFNYYAYGNVIQNSTTSPGTHILCQLCGTSTVKNSSGVAITTADNLAATSGLVDSSGYLTGTNTQYIGTYGFELTGSAPPSLTPNPPSSIIFTP